MQTLKKITMLFYGPSVVKPAVVYRYRMLMHPIVYLVLLSWKRLTKATCRLLLKKLSVLVVVVKVKPRKVKLMLVPFVVAMH